ncbi:MAG: bifunctional hydroxymethylpyrimidine kinase/phosphomethylpyrimidine kinase [Kiritimatiellae bacterium]|nr:bifunctional hydroxymethylpyrimidine kinase/phosphomethylpyrimidine kinase [Kiritimatiellia bacterium]
MTIAGSDSGCGAGIQADLKTFHTLRIAAATVVTCVTAQNPKRILYIEPLAPFLVESQIRAIGDFFSIAAAKTGVLYSAPIIRTVAACLKKFCIPQLVVDPVMVSSSGTPLLENKALSVLCDELFPLATVLTPNIREAEAILGIRIHNRHRAEEAARLIGERFGCACLLKGGHLPSNAGRGTDLLYTGSTLHAFEEPPVPGRSPHGTGCTFSAALTAFLALGKSLVEATVRAKRFVRQTLLAPTIRKA